MLTYYEFIILNEFIDNFLISVLMSNLENINI